MRRKWLWTTMLALPVAIGGWVYAGTQTKTAGQSSAAGFVCPLTGETLPCPDCCPLK